MKPSKPQRETRLIDKSTFDDPTESCLAGSNEEADLIAEWDRVELVDTIQQLDEKVFDHEQKIIGLKAEIAEKDDFIFQTKHVGSHNERLLNEAKEKEARIAEIEKALQITQGHSNCYCDKCKEISTKYWSPSNIEKETT